MAKALTQLSEALPVVGRVSDIRLSFNRSVLSSLKYLFEACEDVVPTDIYQAASQRLKNLKVESKFSGILNAIHADFLRAINQEDLPRINKIFTKFVRDDFQVEKIKYINISDLDEYYRGLVENISSQEIIENITFFPLSSANFNEVKGATEAGFKVLERSFPDFFLEGQELISEVLVLNAKGVKAGSSYDLYGTIYKSYIDKWETLTDILDFIIHEQSHLYVHLLSNDDPIVLNPTERYESPLRKEKRPLMGSYHATFVLARVCYVLKKALDVNEIPETERDYCQELLEYYIKRFHVGFDLLKTHAQMTPLAKDLIQSASKLVA